MSCRRPRPPPSCGEGSAQKNTMAGQMAFDSRPLRIAGDSGIWWPSLIPAYYLLFCPCTLEQVPHLSPPGSFMCFILKLSLFAKEGQFFLYYQGSESGWVERVLELTGPPVGPRFWSHGAPPCHCATSRRGTVLGP